MKVNELEERILQDVATAMQIMRRMYLTTQAFIELYSYSTGRTLFEAEDVELYPATMPSLLVPMLYFSDEDLLVKSYREQSGMFMFALSCIDRRLSRAYEELAQEIDFGRGEIPGVIYITQKGSEPYRIEFDPVRNIYHCHERDAVPEDEFELRLPSEKVPLRVMVPYIIKKIHNQTDVKSK